MKHIHFLCTLACAVLLSVWTGCSATVEFHASAVSSDSPVCCLLALGPAFMDTVAGLAGSGESAGGPLFDSATVESQFAAAGFTGVHASVPAKNKLALSAPLSALGSGVVTVLGRRMEVTFSPERLKAVYLSLPPAEKAYADLFMAPVFTGESMSKFDYLELVGSLYGQPLADEIESAVFTMVLYGPDGTGVKKASAVPLTDLLLGKTVSYAVSW